MDSGVDSSNRSRLPFQNLCARIVTAAAFERTVIALILVNGVIVGLETSPAVMAGWAGLLHLGNWFIVTAFVLEASLKIYSVAPRWSRYFGDGWNLFDFSVVVASLIPASGGLATVARLARLLRVLRLVSALPQLRLIIATLMRSIPSMGHVIMLMGIIFYIYAVLGYNFFHNHDPTHWGSLPLSLLTLFRVVTLEDWTDVMYTAMEFHPAAWVYFVSFVILGTFIVVNLFIAVVLNNLEEAKAERLHELELPPSREELMDELRRTQDSLERLHARLRSQDEPPAAS